MLKILLFLLILITPTNAQMSGGSMFPGPGMPASTGYQGPGDVVSGATIFFSCARVYTAAQASTSTSLCDLVSSTAPTVVLCTLRGSSTGFVDLSAYCAGALTPAATCAAATGGVCNVQKVYDQTGAGNHATNNTASSQPVLTFSGANSLPGLTCTSAAASVIITTATFTPSLPYTFTGVAKRTSSPTVQQAIAGFVTTPNIIGFANSANTVLGSLDNTTNLTLGSQTDSNYHAIQYLADTSPNAVIASDGTEASGNSGTGTPSAKTFRVCRFSGGNSLNGVVMEIGWWATTGFNGTQRTNLNTNMHGSSGYNF